MSGVFLAFEAERAELHRLLGQVETVVPAKDLIPVLQNIEVSTEGFSVTFTGSDSTVSAISSGKALTVGTQGRELFPADRLSHIIREADADSVLSFKVLTKKGAKVAQITTGKVSWTVPLNASSGFPSFAELDSVGTVPTAPEELLAALQQVRKAVSDDPMRPYLMMVDVSKGRVRASDSIRFQQVKAEFPFDCQIPSRSVTELCRRLSNTKTLEVGQTNNALIFKFDNAKLFVQKIAAKFPDVDEVLLKPALTNDLEFEVNRKDLIKAIRRVRVTADEMTSAVVLSLNEGSVSVESKDRRGGVSVETLPANWKHSPRHLSFNHLHLSDMLASGDAETCVFRLGKDLKTRPSPLLMEESGGLLAVLSQIRLDWME